MLTSDEIREMYYEQERRKNKMIDLQGNLITPWDAKQSEEQWLKVIESKAGILFCYWDEPLQQVQWGYRIPITPKPVPNWQIYTPRSPWATIAVHEPIAYADCHPTEYINSAKRVTAEHVVYVRAGEKGLVKPVEKKEVPVADPVTEEKKKPAFSLTITVTGLYLDSVTFTAKQLIEMLDKQRDLRSVHLAGTSTEGTCTLEIAAKS